MNASPLEIKLLGPVEVSYQGQSLQINRRIERALLYYLAVEHRPIPRTTLIDIFWPDDDSIDQRRALRTALSRLKKALPDPDLVVTQLDQVWLDVDKITLDMAIFEDLFLGISPLLPVYQENRPLPAQIVKQIHEALDLWRGDNFLIGDNLSSYPELENWRQNWEMQLLYYQRLLLNRLAKHYQADGRLELAIDTFVRLGRIDLLNIDVHSTIIDLIIKLGRYQEVVDYCDSLEIVYEKQFNAHLPDAILSKCQYAQIQIDATDRHTIKAWPSVLTMQLRLVGRQEELETLQKAFHQGGVVALKGELGSGKTRLLKELFYTLVPTPFLLLAPSLDMENILPLSPIIHSLRHHVPEVVWCEIDPTWANQISLVIPEIADIRDDIDPSRYLQLSPGKQPLFDALLQVLRMVARKFGRILFVLDDAQWADKQTLQALAYILMHGFFDQDGLLVIASRSEEPNRDLEEMIDKIYRSHPVKGIKLDGLSPSELGLLAGQALNITPAGSFINQLYCETNGNPFFALEIIRNVLELPGWPENFSSDTLLPLPDSIHTLIRRRLNQLDENVRRVLVCAAVIGNTFSTDILREITSQNQIADSGAIDQLIQFGFVHASPEASSLNTNLQFIHEKMREVVLKEAPAIQLQLLHRQVAEHLAIGPQAKTKAAIIANHYAKSGDLRNTFQWLLQAADYAWLLGAKDDAISTYQQAEGLYLTAPQDIFSTDEIFKLYNQWSEFAYQADQKDMLEQIGFKLQYLGEEKQDPLLIGVSQMILANACNLRFRVDNSIELIKKAIANLELTDERLTLIHAIVRQGNYYWWAGKYNEAIKSAKKALDMANSIQEETPEKISYILYAYNLIGMFHYVKGETRKALHYAQKIHQIDLSKLSPFDHMRANMLLAHVALLSGDYSDCERYALRGMEITQVQENPYIYETFMVLYSRIKFITGHLDEAYALALKAHASGEANGNVYTIVQTYSLIGDIYQILMNHSQAIHFYRLAQIRSGFFQSSVDSLQNEIHLARLLAHTGRVAEAKETIEQVLKTTQTKGMKHLYSLALTASGLCDLKEDNHKTASEKFAKSLEIANENHLRHEMIISKLGQVQIALAQRSYQTAEKITDVIIPECQELQSVWLLLNALSLGIQLSQVQNQEIPLEYQSLYKSLIDKIQEQTKTDALAEAFGNAREVWEKNLYHH